MLSTEGQTATPAAGSGAAARFAFILAVWLLATPPVAAQVGSAGSVPDGADQPGEPLRLARDATGALTLTWGASCSPTDFDYSIYSGPLFEIISDFVERTNFDNHEPLICSTGIGQTSATIVPDGDDAYYLVVPHDRLIEGSYGSSSTGLGRPRGPGACRPQSIGCGAVPPNRPPVALPDANTSFIGEPAAIDVMANDLDLDFGPAPIGVIAVTQPVSGTTTILPTGQVLYSPLPTFAGVDSFDYTLTDGLENAVAQVTVTVVPPQPQPTAALTVTPPAALPGEAVTLNWSGSGASATLDGAPVPLTGSLEVRPLMTTSYELVVTGEPGTTPALSVAIVALPECTVEALPAPTVPPCPVWCGSGIVPGFGSSGNLVLAPADMVHVLMLSEGYTQAEHDGGEFDQDIQEWIDKWVVLEPYTTLQEAFCIWKLPITSSQYASPGVPDPGDTAFLVPITDDNKGVGSVPADGPTAQKVWETVPLFPYQPTSFYPPGGRMSLLAKNLIPVLLVYKQGSSSGYSGKAPRLNNPGNASQRFVAGIAQNRVHEFTHAFSRVRDEYMKDDGEASCGANDLTDTSAGVTNVVCDEDCTTVPWTHLIEGSAINPNTPDLVGVFGHADEGFRPEAKCFMNGTVDNAKYFGGDGKLRVERMCNFCRELAVFRLLERVHLLDDPDTSWEIWKTTYRDDYFAAHPFSVPIPVPQENSVGAQLCPLCPATDVCP